MKRTATLILLMLAMYSCNNNNAAKATEQSTPVVSSVPAMPVSNKIPADSVDNKEDFICGMPVRAGIEDTAHYEGKVYGFCATGCKEEFQKNPKQYLVKK